MLFRSHNDLAFFKFGSVIGFRNSGGKVTTSRIAFDPSRLFVGNDDSDYATIPSWDNENFATYNAANDWDKYSYCPSGSNYHTVANIKLGKGDPCKLAGFTENDIISKLNAGDLPDNGLWRLPTKAEQLGYIKGTLTVTGTTFKDSIWNYWNTLSSWSDKENYPYATFPFINSSEVNPLGSRLPAAGRTNSLGWAQNLHAVGSYWSSSLIVKLVRVLLHSMQHLSYQKATITLPMDVQFAASLKCPKTAYQIYFIRK